MNKNYITVGSYVENLDRVKKYTRVSSGNLSLFWINAYNANITYTLETTKFWFIKSYEDIVIAKMQRFTAGDPYLIHVSDEALEFTDSIIELLKKLNEVTENAIAEKERKRQEFLRKKEDKLIAAVLDFKNAKNSK